LLIDLDDLTLGKFEVIEEESVSTGPIIDRPERNNNILVELDKSELEEDLQEEVLNGELSVNTQSP